MPDVLSFVATAADTLAALDGRAVGVAVALQAANLVLRAFAWRNVLAAAYPERRVPVLGVGAAYAVGVALNGFLPARGGEAAKVALVRAQLHGSSVPVIASSGAVILLFDSLVGLSLLAAASALGAVPAPSLPTPGGTAVIPLGLLALALPLLAVPAVRGRVRRLGNAVAQGMAILRRPRRYLTGVASLQAAAWTCRIGAVWALLWAFDLSASPTVAAAVVVAAGASTMVPAPGGVGAQQLLLVYVLVGVASAAEALSFAVTMQAGVTVLNAAIGLVAAMIVFRTVSPWNAAATAVRTART